MLRVLIFLNLTVQQNHKIKSRFYFHPKSLLFSIGVLVAVILSYTVMVKASDCASPMRLYVSVSDRSDNFIQDLQATDFKVVEKKRPQKLSHVDFISNEAISLGVLLDISRDMQGEKIRLALSLLKDLVANLESPDEIFISAFNDETEELLDFIAPEDYLDDPIENLSTGGRPQMGQALDLALIKLREARNETRAILFISGGRDIAGPSTLDHIAQHGHPIYALGFKGAGNFGSKLKVLNIRGSALKVYADRSGGRSIFFESAEEASVALNQLTFELKNKFLLEYCSSHPKQSRNSRKIRVEVSNNQYQLRYLKKYITTRR